MLSITWSTHLVILTNSNKNQRILHHYRATVFKYNIDGVFNSEFTRWNFTGGIDNSDLSLRTRLGCFLQFLKLIKSSHVKVAIFLPEFINKFSLTDFPDYRETLSWKARHVTLHYFIQYFFTDQQDFDVHTYSNWTAANLVQFPSPLICYFLEKDILLSPFVKNLEDFRMLEPFVEEAFRKKTMLCQWTDRK